ncbi:MAG: DUF1345 domain-containing protein [Sphingomonadales bacterium]|jgi:uncharacterized membrane protein
MNWLKRFPHYAAFAGVMLALLAALPGLGLREAALLLAFDGGVIAFLAALAWRMRGRSPVQLRAGAAEPGHAVLRSMALLVMAVVLFGLATEMKGGAHDPQRLLLAAGSLSMAWLFANSLFSLHYMHLYYQPAGKDIAAGLEFPGDDAHPDFGDFLYFAFTIGMTFQVSDVVITTRPVRRLALAHGLLAFGFNIAVIAVTVSLVASALA